MPFLLKYWKVLGVLLLCLACYAGGRWGSTTSTDKTTDKTAEVDTTKVTDTGRDVTQVNKVTTVTKKADGTTVTTVVDHSKVVETQKKTESVVDKKTEDKTEVKTTTAASSQDNYSLSLNVQNPVSLKWEPDYQAQVGYRLLGPIWGNVSYDITTHKPGIGLSITFP